LLIALALLIAQAVSRRSPLLVWNASNSVPIGLYRIRRTTPRVDDLVLVRLAGAIANLTHRRAYLLGTAYLLKPVFAVAGDRVCRFGIRIFVRRRLAALALHHDRNRRAMPTWHGCLILQSGEFFLLAKHPASFDSRYFGPVRTDRVVGPAARLWPPR
jgi:conjugative transfer signal peptidase TraF